MAKVIARTLQIARVAKDLSVLTMQGFPGRWHWLVGDRRGQISADLDKMNRIIFLPKEEMEEIEEGGNLHNERVTGLIAIEITDTHE